MYTYIECESYEQKNTVLPEIPSCLAFSPSETGSEAVNLQPYPPKPPALLAPAAGTVRRSSNCQWRWSLVAAFMCVFLATQKKDHPKTPKPGACLPKKKQEVNCISPIFGIAKDSS